MIRRVGDPPQGSQRYILRPGAYAILPMGQRFLLTVQSAQEIDVQLPGGGIDPGESSLHALFREVLEETGWSIARPRRMGAFRRFVYMPEYDLWAEKLCHVYSAHPVRQISEPIEPAHATVFLPAADAIGVLGNDGDRMFLHRYVAAAP